MSVRLHCERCTACDVGSANAVCLMALSLGYSTHQASPYPMHPAPATECTQLPPPIAALCHAALAHADAPRSTYASPAPAFVRCPPAPDMSFDDWRAATGSERGSTVLDTAQLRVRDIVRMAAGLLYAS